MAQRLGAGGLSARWGSAPEVAIFPWSHSRTAEPSLAACGYHTAGHSVRSAHGCAYLAIPSFENQTHTYIWQRLTAAVVRELITRTHYRIVNRPPTTPTPPCRAPSSPPRSPPSPTTRSPDAPPPDWSPSSSRSPSPPATGGSSTAIPTTSSATSTRSPMNSPASLKKRGRRSTALQDFARTLVTNILEAGWRPSSGLLPRSSASCRRSSPQAAPGYVFVGDEAFFRRTCRDAILQHLVPEGMREFSLYEFDLEPRPIVEILDRARTRR